MSFHAPIDLPEPAGAALGMPPQITPAEFSAVAAIMQQRARIHLPDTKMTLVYSRLSRRLRAHGLRSFSRYIELVRQDPVEMATMVEALTTNHTHFFREPHHFEHLKTVLPVLKDKARSGGVRIWSAGCSSGEEVHTIAMTLLGTDAASARWALNGDVRLLATDISSEVVGMASRGHYASDLLDQIPQPYARLWTKPTTDGFEILPEVRAMVTAKVLNLFDSWPLSRKFDLIFCRNVMIYFDSQAKEELEARLVDQLEPGGFLYIGHSERLNGPAKDNTEPCGQTIYVKKGGHR
ncbi:MAG: protein-glutamate O-methyltransferase CheR [Sphingobium sp.]|nr:protein-glutamate O-methyltransferase CheR [Sphingobium sp.]